MPGFVGNTNRLELLGLQDSLTADYIDDATVTVTIKDKANVNLTGLSWPQSMSYVTGSDGDYRIILPDNLGWVANMEYYATITATSAGIGVGKWKFKFTARTRAIQ